MKRKTKQFLSCASILFLLCFLVFPCSAFVADIEDSLIVNDIFGCANSNFEEYYRYNRGTFYQGDTTEMTFSMAKDSVDIIPNYFYHQMDIMSSNGLPIAEGGKTWKFGISNFYEYMTVDTSNGGDFPLQSVTKIMVKFKYSSGDWSGMLTLPANGFVYNSDTNKCTLSFSISPTSKHDIVQVQVRYFYNYSNFGFNRITGSDNLYDYIYRMGCDNLLISREQTFPSADPEAFNNYESTEKELIEGTSGGLQDVTSAFGNLTNIMSPSGSMYKGVLFMGSLMKEFVYKVPALNDIILVSLAIGVITIILGFGTDVAVRSLKGSNNKQKPITGKKKGG